MEHCRSYDVAAGTSREMRNGNVKKKEIWTTGYIVIDTRLKIRKYNIVTR
jgi:hypothetical protein